MKKIKRIKSSNIVKMCIRILFVVVFGLTIISIYNLAYKVLYHTDIPYLYNTTLHYVRESNYKPIIKNNDYLILEKGIYYSEDDLIVHKYYGGYKISKIVSYNAGSYITEDTNNKYYKVDTTTIVGKVTKNIHGLGIIIKVLTTPLVIIALAILIAAYFLLSIYEKDS